MKISVITCTWNSLPFLEQSINSVLAQDFESIEYIFVDGGSTDGTLERIAAIPREVKVLHNVSGGIAKAMNAGIQAATGDVVAHLHSDDYYQSIDVLTKVAKEFERTQNKWLFGRVKFDVNGVIASEGYEVPRYSYRKLLMRNFIPHPATFIRREVFDKCGLFDEKLRYAMDYEFWLRIGRIHTPLQLDDYFVVFRRHAGSATQANFLQSFNEDFKVRWGFASWLQMPEVMARYMVRRYRLNLSGVRDA